MKLKTFRQFISEAPTPTPDAEVDPYHIRDKTNSINLIISKKHHNSDKLEDTDEGSIHRLDDMGFQYYYHHVNGKPREMSEIDDEDNQIFTTKNGGDSKYNKKFLYHHAKDFGVVKSDNDYSKGGEKLWKDIINTPVKGYSVYHKGVKITPENLRQKQSDIWKAESEIDGVDNKRLIMKKD